MNTFKRLLVSGLGLATVAAVLAGCTNTDMAHITSYGQDGHIVCFSGGKLVLDDFSSGKISNASESDGYDFMSLTTGRLEQVNGDCVIDYGGTKLANWHATIPGVTYNPS